MKKFMLALSICLCMLSALLFVGCDKKIVSATVKQGTIDTIVFENQQLDTSDLVVTFVFDDDSTIDVAADKLSIGTIDTSVVGQTTLTVTYKGFSFDIPIQVKKLEIQSATITAGTLNKTVLLGGTLDTSNVSVRYTLNDNTYVNIPANRLTFGSIDTSTEGQKQLDISYTISTDNTYTFSTTINVLDPQKGIDEHIKSAQVKQGTIDLEIFEGETLVTSNVVLTITLKDDSVVDVAATQLNFSAFDNTTVGENDLAIGFCDFTYTIQIEVKSLADQYTVSNFTSLLLTEFTSNNDTKSNSQIEFVNKNTVITVGDDNPVDFRIEATHTQGVNTISLTKVRTNFVVKIKDGTEYTVLEQNQLATYAILDTENSTIDFTEAAIGHEFEVEISPKNCDGVYLLPSQATRTLKFKVVDGYNVYDAKHLSVFDNMPTDKWTELKTSIGVQDINAKNVILLKSITITDSDIPSSHFWATSTTGYSELVNKTNLALEGSFIDATSARNLNSVYKRIVGDNDDFTFYGNGFSVNAQALSKAVVDAENNVIVVPKKSGDPSSYITTHTSLFKLIPQLTFTNGEYDEEEVSEHQSRPSKGKATFDSIYFLGNGQRTDEAVYSGSIILCKARAVNFTAQNTIYKDFFIGYFGEYGLSTTEGVDSAKFMLKDTKGYNNYNTHLYLWGVEDCMLVNTTLSMCGGPVIIADHVGYGNGDTYNNYNKTTGAGGYPSHINAIGCTLQSYIGGSEPWFTTYGATEQISTLKTANALFTPLGKSITTTYTPEVGDPTPNALNMILVFKNCSAKGITAGSINRGWMRIFDTQEDYNKYYDTTSPEKTTYGFDLGSENFGDNNTVAQKPYTTTGNPLYFESSRSGGYTNSAVQTNGDTTLNTSTGQGTSYADGKYVNVYMPGVGAIIELFTQTA